jgi:Polyketide cyclase / dehydrase and lipid transport
MNASNKITIAPTAKGFGTVQVQTSTLIHAPQVRVADIYRDYHNWPKLFPTIKAVHLLLREETNKTTLEIDHQEGLVINTLTFISSEDIKLEEVKRKYDATFLNHFEAAPEGTRYILVGDISLKGIYKLLTPFLKKYIRKQMTALVLEQLKRYAEVKPHA